MKLKAFIAKAAVVAILSGVVFAPAHYLYQDNESAEWSLTGRFNPEHRFKEYPDNHPAYGYMLSGGTCYKNDEAFAYPDYDTKAGCEEQAASYMEQMKPLIEDGIIYGRTQLASLAVLVLSLGSIVISLSFVGLRKLWDVGK